MVSFARQHADHFTEKPRDPPDYKENPERTKDLERMEEELNEFWKILVALSTRREVVPLNQEEEQQLRHQAGSTPEHHRPVQNQYLDCPPSTSLQVNTDIPINTSHIPIRQSTGHTLDQIRKWNCHYDGRGVYGFLERVREPQ